MYIMYSVLEQSALTAVSDCRSQASFVGTETESIAWSQAPAEAGLLWVRAFPMWAASAILSTARFVLAFFF